LDKYSTEIFGVRTLHGIFQRAFIVWLTFVSEKFARSQDPDFTPIFIIDFSNNFSFNFCNFHLQLESLKLKLSRKMNPEKGGKYQKQEHNAN
jgi:hypothetical protein